MMTETNIDFSHLLEGQLVLVTGAGQGNGRAIALGVARSGARVIVTDVRPDAAEATALEIRSSGSEANAFALDVTDAEACTSLAERVGREIGPVSVLVNNAGIIIRENIDSPRAHENWRRVLDVNVNGTFNVVHACFRRCGRPAVRLSTWVRSRRSWGLPTPSATRHRRGP
jgi:NAD(P)-dependent dehydrogenase (short-subunit alcohol dehydrogenase family)